MLNQMRSLSQNWIGRTIMGIILAFIIVSFAIWGIGDRFSNFNASELAKVGSTSISVDVYRNAYQTQLQRLEQSQKRGITNEEAQRLGLDRQVLSQILRDAILDQEARKLGLAVGDAQIARLITSDDAFKGPDGRFDRARFDMLMRDNGFTEARYERDQRSAILRQDVSDAVTAGLTLPDVVAAAVHRFKSEVRAFDFVVLPDSAAGEVPKPTDAQLTTFYDDRPRAFTAPEYRKLVVLSIVPANLVKPQDVSDTDVKKRYDEMKAARFVVPEKRTLEQLVFPDQAAADAAKAQLAGGTTFDKLVADEKKTEADVSLGTVAKSELADPKVADAAFALPEGGTSQPIKGEFGSVLVHVSKITPMRQQPLEEVAAQLRDELAIIKARADANRMRDAVEDARTSGKTLTEAAAAVGLKTLTIDAIDVQGFDKAHKPVEGLVDGPAMLKAAFATDVGADTEMLQTSAGGNVWYEVAGVQPARRVPLAEIKPKVEAVWRQSEIDRRLVAKGDALVAAIDGGKSLETVAGENGKLQIMKAANLTRGGGPSLSPTVAGVVFSVPVGKAGTVADRGVGRIIFKVVSARVPPVDPRDTDFSKLMDQVKTGYTDDVLSQYLLQLQAEVGVKINQQALQSALGTDSGS